MIALQIHHNDRALCVAGASDLGVLNAIVNAVGVLGPDSISKREGECVQDLFITVGGLTSRKEPPDEHIRWLEQTPLSVGDCIKITLLDSNEADGPVNRTEAEPRDRDEERKEFEIAKKTYLRLRHFYEQSTEGDGA